MNFRRNIKCNPWRILVTDGLHETGLNILERESEVVVKNDILADDLIKEIADFDALIIRSRTKVSRQIMEAAPKLKVIGRAGVGVDNIDIKTAKEKGITVVNAASSTTTAVAELTIGLIFALARQIPRRGCQHETRGMAKKRPDGCGALW